MARRGPDLEHDVRQQPPPGPGTWPSPAQEADQNSVSGPSSNLPGRTAIRCTKCGHRNLAIDIWCATCRSHLDFTGEQRQRAPVAGRPRRRRATRSHLADEFEELLKRGREWDKEIAAAISAMVRQTTEIVRSTLGGDGGPRPG